MGPQSGSIIRDTAKEAAQAAPVVAATASKARSVATHAIAAATDKRKNNQKDSAGLSQKVHTCNIELLFQLTEALMLQAFNCTMKSPV